MATQEDVKAMFDLGICIGEMNERVRMLRQERDEARAVIAKAEAMVNGHADNDYRIAEDVLRPYLAKYPTEGGA